MAFNRRSESGVALFMVIAGISVLSILVTEFTYVAQVNQKIAYDGLDQLKAHYLAKSGLKLSLLRLKAYQTVKGVVGGGGNGGSGSKNPAVPGLPRQVLEKIWSFPFFYPLPTNVPGISQGDKDRIEKFQKESSMDGRFTAVIQSESSKYNLNMILAPFAPTGTTGATGATGATGSTGSTSSPPPPGGTTSTTAPTGPAFDPQAARNSLSDYLQDILTKKFESDPDFAAEYRDFRMDDFMDALLGWADFSYERRVPPARDELMPKKQPFYSLSELHMLPGMDDRLFDVLAPALTASTTPGINVNTMAEPTLRALVPKITDEEAKEFYKFRDSEEEDNLFKDSEAFFKYLRERVAAFRQSESEINSFKENLKKRNIRLVVDETEFKITVQAQVNQATRLIEAWVTLGPQKKSQSPRTGNASQPPASGASAPAPGGGQESAADPGLKITFMRIL